MPKKKNKKKSLMLIIAIMLLLIISIAVILFGMNNNPEAEGTTSESTWGDDMFSIDPTVDEQLQDYRNVLIFGLDKNHRTDIIFVASINKKTNKANLVTVWRDTYMQLNENKSYFFKGAGKEFEFFKCNHAYFKGNKFVAIKEFNRHMDLNCRECIGLDWDTIARLVEGVGGIEVDVTPAMIDKTNGLIRSMGYTSDLISSTGMQKLNGHQSVGYLRTRKDATAVQRSERNQEVFMQIFQKIKKMSNSEKMDLFDSISDDIESNMSSNTMTEILEQLSTYEVESCGGWPNNYSIMWDDVNAFYYYVPNNLENSVTELHKRIFNQEDYEPTSVVKTLSDKIKKNKETILH